MRHLLLVLITVLAFSPVVAISAVGDTLQSIDPDTVYSDTLCASRDIVDMLMIYVGFTDRDSEFNSLALPAYWDAAEDSIENYYEDQSFGNHIVRVTTARRLSPSQDSCFVADSTWEYWADTLFNSGGYYYQTLGDLNEEIMAKAYAEDNTVFDGMEVVSINYHHGPIFHKLTFGAVSGLGGHSSPYWSGRGMSNAFGGNGLPNFLRTIGHEYGHILGNWQHHNTGQYCIMEDQVYDYSDGNVSYCPYHLMKMGWIDNSRIIEIDSTRLNVSIGDVNNDSSSVYKIYTSATDYFLVANHQQTKYDSHHEDTGLFIWHYTGNDDIDLESAEGRYNWATETCNGGANTLSYPFSTSSANANSGKDELDLYGVWVCDDGDSVNTFHPGMTGDAEDFWTPSGSNRFTPYTNPNTNDGSTKTYLFIDINSETNGVINFDIKFDYPPSTPTSFSLNSSGSHPVLSWSAPASDIDHYVLERKYTRKGLPPATPVVSSVNVSTTSYTDNDFDLGGATTYYAEYKVKAVDEEDQESGWTSTKKTDGYTMMMKGIAEGEDILPIEYKLRVPYPNPFNPTINLSYDLPVSSDMLIEIRDIRGMLVETMNISDKPAGYHTFRWNPKQHVPAGLYMIQLRAIRKTDVEAGHLPNEFINTVKVLYLK
ncbi:MAG: hypothetical protein K9M49_06040 [Candidatus Marinimicrobia bacterium]|nr:hypothetical protein [Candidatus Neomarinimicrobiota bacterium]MCF7904695.1 hypothetical protein [Candidatus Neomarinimicrobiota bacterium]